MWHSPQIHIIGCCLGGWTFWVSVVVCNTEKLLSLSRQIPTCLCAMAKFPGRWILNHWTTREVPWWCEHFKVFIGFATIMLLFSFYFLFFWPQSIWDLSSLTRDSTCTPCIRRQSLNPWTPREVSPDLFCLFYIWFCFIFIFASLGLCFFPLAFSSCRSRDCPSLWCSVFSLQCLLLLRSTDSRYTGFVTLWNVGSSWA